uniref:vegetative cell wall protein gp1-like n=1 Tax=Erigeron canadensis TaxID=72917 RepID=UPI001CB9535E|nr:vegetative cell wall protein gp1-like [Erigeron canadensis]
MADKKPSGFRFRLPWLPKPALTTSPAVSPEPPSQPTRSAPPTQPPRTTTQTSAQRPPFRPPGKAPAPAAQPTVATPAPASPRQSPPQSVSPPQPPPPPSVPAKSPVIKSPIAKSVGIQPTKEIEATTETTPALETPGLATPPQRSPLRSPRRAQSPPSPPQTPPPFILTESSPPESPMAKTIETVAAQPAKDSQTLTETMPTREMPGPATTHQRSPLGPPKQGQPQPGHPQTPPPSKPDSQPSSPSRLHTPPQPNSQDLLPSHMVAQPNVPTSPSSLSPEPTRTRATTHPLSTPPKSPSRSPSPTTKITSEFAVIKRPTKTSDEKFPNDSNLKGPETEAMNLHKFETKSQKAKPTSTTRLPLHREIKDDISQLINKILATSLPKQHIDEKHASIITLAGENNGASMHLASDSSIKPDSKLGDHYNNQETTKAILNSNAQGVNNSMMFNSSATERNPGVHLRISRDLPNINDSDMSDTDSMEMQRAEVNLIPPQKLVYNPAFGIDDDLEISVSTGNEIKVL